MKMLSHVDTIPASLLEFKIVWVANGEPAPRYKRVLSSCGWPFLLVSEILAFTKASPHRRARAQRAGVKDLQSVIRLTALLTGGELGCPLGGPTNHESRISQEQAILCII